MFTIGQRKSIREQLDRLLVSSLFRNSKRCPRLLRYVVERVLDGDGEPIKERALGTVLFNLEPDYDTALHPVVRMTAVEVRKRLKEYYDTRGHENELRIDLPRGSYIPIFVLPEEAIPDEPTRPTDKNESPLGSHWRLATIFGICAALCVSIGWKIFAQNTALASFWEPIVDAKASVLVCMPNPADLAVVRGAFAQNPQQLLALPASASAPIHDRTSFSDSVALSSVGRLLGSKGQTFLVRRASSVAAQDLSQSPAVLIGAFDNRWTLALTNQMRYSFAIDEGTEYVRDSQNPSSRDWSLSSALAPVKDYGIISRTFTPTTGNFIVTIAGLGRDATLAAGNCVADAACMEQARRFAAGDWKHKNIQMVIATAVSDNTPDSARVIRAYTW